MEPSINLYDILEVGRDATGDEIKRSYHKLAIKYHPDKNNDPNATQKFQNISLAYEILSDPEKRRKYDVTGSIDDDILKFNPFVNIFNVFFQQGYDYKLGVQYEDLICGIVKIVTLQEKVWTDVHGNPAKMEPCNNCREQSGLGVFFSNMCRSCDGKKMIPVEGSHQTETAVKYEIKIPPNSWPGRVLEFNGKKFKIVPMSDPKLTHQGLDLIYEHKLTIFEALLARPQTIEIAKKTYKITFTHPINPNTKVIYEERGLAGPNGQQGNIIIIFDILFPKTLTEKEKSIIETLIE